MFFQPNSVDPLVVVAAAVELTLVGVVTMPDHFADPLNRYREDNRDMVVLSIRKVLGDSYVVLDLLVRCCCEPCT